MPSLTHENGGQDAGADPRAHRINLTLSVCDAGQLWRAARDRATSRFPLSNDEMMELIGPPNDPSVAECLAMLLAPGHLPGCRLRHFWIDRPDEAVAPAEVPGEAAPSAEPLSASAPLIATVIGDQTRS